MNNIKTKTNLNTYTTQYYFEVEHNWSAYIWNHYQINKYTEKSNISEEDIVMENGRLKGFLYKGKFFSKDDIDKWEAVKCIRQQGGQEQTSIEQACLRRRN